MCRGTHACGFPGHIEVAPTLSAALDGVLDFGVLVGLVHGNEHPLENGEDSFSFFLSKLMRPQKHVTSSSQVAMS